MSQSLGVAVIVENRPGAGGNVGAAAVAKGDASGHQLLMAPSAILATNQWLYKDLGYDPQKDLTPVINAATTPNMWVAHPQVEARTIADVLAAARAKPGALAFASGGNGTTGHLCGELLKTTAKVDLLHVPYKGPAPALQDVIAGRVPLMCDNFSNVISARALGEAEGRRADRAEAPSAGIRRADGARVGPAGLRDRRLVRVCRSRGRRPSPSSSA